MSRHTHRVPDPKTLEAKAEIIEILRTLPNDKAFYFYTAPGNFTGETATSIDSFVEKLQIIAGDSISFHLQKGDFQKWIKDTLGDAELAKRISLIKSALSVEDSRKELLEIVETRIAELRRELPHHLRHTHT